jgi:ATP-dependent Clp protease protease subunit
LKDALAGLDENEPLEVEITSEGGSVFAGIQLANMLARWKGEVTTHGVGFVASIATVILMAGKNVTVDDNCFCLIHLPWTMVQGNANDLNKEIENLEKCKHAMMSFYMRKAIVDAQTIEDYLAEESWFLGSELAQIFRVDVIANDEQFDIAAKFDLSKYKNLPRGLNMKNKQIEEEEKKPVKEPVEEKADQKTDKPEQADEQNQNEEEKPVEEKADEDAAKPADEEPVEESVEEPDEKKEEPDADELKKKIEELTKENDALKASVQELTDKLAECAKPDDEEKVTKAECERRVSGM